MTHQEQPTHEDKPLPHDPGHVRAREHYERLQREAASDPDLQRKDAAL